MSIIKSTGVTPTERLLANLCENSFLKLWSYPSPFKDDRKELCDLLAVFENHVFIFFDRESRQFEKATSDVNLNWDRWRRNAVDDQIRTAHGAERYIRSGGNFFDNALANPFPIKIDPHTAVIHKIIVAHGAADACKQASEHNVSGSLAICYGNGQDATSFPFLIDIDKDNPVHIFDSHSLPIILRELDTYYDLSRYLDAKNDAIKRYDSLIYAGEEDLLAHYWANYDVVEKKYAIGTKDEGINGIMIGEGEWKDFVETDRYKDKKLADRESYLWDHLIQKTCQNALNGTLGGNLNIGLGQSAIHEMAKEPRFVRRSLTAKMIAAIRNFPDLPGPIVRNTSFMNSYYEGKGYVFLQLKMDIKADYESEYRPNRQALLELACAAAKNKFPNLKKIIGIAIEAPKFSKIISEDFILMDCEDWPDER